jgi:hypothetical protein
VFFIAIFVRYDVDRVIVHTLLDHTDVDTTTQDDESPWRACQEASGGDTPCTLSTVQRLMIGMADPARVLPPAAFLYW